MKRMPYLSSAARRQLARGTRVELEHTRSRRVARLIAAHHLSESPRYYVELAKMEKKLLRNPIIQAFLNPAPHVPVMSYGAAHRWEAMAKAQGVSAVARSSRGFMRAYERAGTWARLDPWWKNRRNAFVARHMAQVWQNNEKLWKQDKSGNLRPSRRCLALLCWAFMPPGRR